MKLSEDDKKDIINGFIKIFIRLSNEDYQRRVWIKGIGPECDDFDDTCCDFFDQGEPILESYHEFGITESQYQLLIKFRDAFRTFSKRDYLPQDFLSDPEWKKITEMAKEILVAFNYKTSD